MFKPGIMGPSGHSPDSTDQIHHRDQVFEGPCIDWTGDSCVDIEKRSCVLSTGLSCGVGKACGGMDYANQVPEHVALSGVLEVDDDGAGCSVEHIMGREVAVDKSRCRGGGVDLPVPVLDIVSVFNDRALVCRHRQVWVGNALAGKVEGIE